MFYARLILSDWDALLAKDVLFCTEYFGKLLLGIFLVMSEKDTSINIYTFFHPYCVLDRA